MKFSDFSTNTHENTGLFGVLTMFESSVSDVSHDDFALQMESKESMPRETDCLTERERKREGFATSAAESMSKKSRRNNIRSHSLQTLRKFYSKSSTRLIGENSIERKLYLKEYKMEIQNLKQRNSEYASFKSLLAANQNADQAQRKRIHLCGRLWMKDHLIKKAMQEVAEKFEELKKTLLSRKKLLKTTKIGIISYATYDQESRTVSVFFNDLDFTEQLWRTYDPYQALITSSSRKRSREVGLPRNTRDNMRIPGNVFDRQHARREADELHNDSRNLAISLAILRTERIEKNESEETIAINTFTLLLSKNKEKKSRDGK